MATINTLTPSQREAVAQTLADGGNVSQVARMVGNNPMHGEQNKAIVNDPKIQSRAVELVKTKFERRAITADRVMTEISRLAFASAKDMFDPATGRPLAIHEMDDDTAATVVGFDMETRMEGRGDAATPYTVTKVKRGDKLGALTLLAKHFKLVNDDEGINALAGALADRLNAAKRRVLVQQVDDVYDEAVPLPAPTPPPGDDDEQTLW